MFGTYRTVLALFVVVQHLGGYSDIGNYAVFGFYVISGFLMTLIMHESYGYTSKGISAYALNRVLRIYPIYWISILLSLTLIGVFGSDVSSAYHHAILFPSNISDMLKNLFLFFPTLDSIRLTPPSWALTVELFFYILIGLGLSKNRNIVYSWFFFSLGYHVVNQIFCLGWDSYFTLIAASLPFSTGALIYHIKDRIQIVKRMPKSLARSFPVLLVAAIGFNWIVAYLRSDLSSVHYYINYSLCSIVVLSLAQTRDLPFINGRLDKLLGDLSYPIYLIHYQVGLLVMLLLNEIGFSVARPSTFLLVVSTPCIIVVAWIMTITLERPIEVMRSVVKAGVGRSRSAVERSAQ